MIRALIQPLYAQDGITLRGPDAVALPDRWDGVDPWASIWTAGHRLYLVVHDEQRSEHFNEAEAAIIDHILRRHGGGRLQPAAGTAEYEAYNQWLHYAEGSAMLPLMLKLYTGRLGEAAAPLGPRIASELANHLGFVDRSLQGRDWLLGEFSGADIQMSFVGEAARELRAQYPAMDAWVRRFQARPAYLRALERGGPYALAS